MNEIDLNKTLSGKWLFLKGNPVSLLSHIVFRIVIKGLLVLILGGFFLSYLVSIGIGYSWMFHLLILSAVLVGTFGTANDFRLREIFSDRPLTLGTEMKGFFESKGWWVRNNNNRYFYATNRIGRANYHFYMVYKEKSVIICSVYELPFPISLYYSNKDINYVRNSASAAGK